MGAGILRAIGDSQGLFYFLVVCAPVNIITDCMSSWMVCAKINQLLLLLTLSITLSTTTFVGQNLGCNQVERAREGANKALLISVVSVIIMMIPVLVFAEPIVAFFNKEPAVVEYGAMLLRWLSPFYILCCFYQIYTAALQGAGNTRAPMISLLSGYVVFRQIYLFIMARICNEIIPIAMDCPASWLVCSLIPTVYFYMVRLGKTRLVED